MPINELENIMVNTTDAIRNWLAERNQLIILYCKLSGRPDQQALPNSQQLSQFCDLLIDYVSAGHFEVYQNIVNECENNGHSSIQLLDKLYPKISQTTDIVVDFNEKYSASSNNAGFSKLDNDLSLLGEAIANRVELEDNLINNLMAKH